MSATLSPWEGAASAMVEAVWRPASPFPKLRPGAVHLWRRTLRGPEVEACAALEPSEWARAGRFHFQRDRDRFLATRVFLREVLGAYLAQPARLVRLARGPHGKPCLAGLEATLRFNLSHSDALLLLAVTEGREVGVDVECMRPDLPFADLAAHYFQPFEVEEVEALPSGRQATRFYEIWTATEARLKAIGEGLGGELPPEGTGGWQWRNFLAAPGFAGAVAAEGDELALECWTWQDA